MFGNHRFTGRKPFVLSFGIILVLTLISSPVRTQGQTWTGPTSGTNVWTNLWKLERGIHSKRH
jgi:hypothetical protein